VDARLATCLICALALGCGPAYLDPAEAGRDYAIQGEYVSTEGPLAAQVIALGGDDFELVLLEGGLPGTAGGSSRTQASTVARGSRRGGLVSFTGPGLVARIQDGQISGSGPQGLPLELIRVERKSPTLGAPPAGATSRQRFADVKLHVEFRTPFMPRSRGQARGNSGIYLQDRYEIQVLDSFGSSGQANECGGIYGLARPAVHMALPPLAWQTYDVDFRAARFDAAGVRTAPARLSVRHNGVLIHDDIELSGPTGRGAPESSKPGPLTLQDHWNPVVFRNVWLLEPAQ